jgi:hypothetical protein
MCWSRLRLPNPQNMPGLYTAPEEGGVADAPAWTPRAKEKSISAYPIKKPLFLWHFFQPVNGWVVGLRDLMLQ